MTVFIAMATVFVSMKSMFVPNEHGLHRDEDEVTRGIHEEYR